MTDEDVPQAVRLQKLAFPPPFSEDLHWDPENLMEHISRFPQGQFVAQHGEEIVGTCSNTLISEERWRAREGWLKTVGGPNLEGFTPGGTTLYGIDITVHPDFRRIGVGRGFYNTRFEWVRAMGLRRYGTACRMPDYLKNGTGISIQEYADEVVRGERVDRTLTPMLCYRLHFLGIIRNYMSDLESEDSAALLEWMP